ncbi:hypothetical protein [Xenorhabdus kozodoii]|uniref:hypothetical protein n=1 Tax=Xenorhabdus kozodoii TaxID=351676 RepID=UPI0011452FBA|nr:hypothetical protein [Xenorhabdus kozodoii]
MEIESNIHVYPSNSINRIITHSFLHAFMRKSCKSALDWLHVELNKLNSPIKGVKFVTNYLDKGRQYNQINILGNVGAYDINKSYSDIGYSYYPITFSEFNYLKSNQELFESPNIEKLEVKMMINEDDNNRRKRFHCDIL